MLASFSKEVDLLIPQVKSRFLLHFFNIEGCELETMQAFLAKTKQQLAFFSQEAVATTKHTEVCAIS